MAEETRNKRFRFEERQVLEKMFNAGEKVAVIARELNRPRQTLYHELKRGVRHMRTSSGEVIDRYYADYAQRCYEAENSKTLIKPRLNDTIKSKVYQMVDEGKRNKEIIFDIKEEFLLEAPALATIHRWIKLYNAEKTGEADGKYSQLGDEAFVNGDFEKAVEYYRKGVSLGDTYCMTGLAFEYVKGRVIQQDFRSAYKLYRRAAELGDSEAMWRLGQCYDIPLGCRRNPELANKCYIKSAGAGNTTGMVFLADALEHGGDIIRNTRQALYWYKEAAKKGHIYAIRWLEEHEEEVMKNLHADIGPSKEGYILGRTMAHVEQLEDLGIENKLSYKEIKEAIKTGEISEIPVKKRRNKK